MIAQLLPTLLSEYYDLSSKLDQVANLIAAYGGAVPSLNKNQIDLKIKANEAMPEQPSVMKLENQSLLPITNTYPKDGSWRMKMLYGLSHFSRPVTATELANYILTIEESADKKTIYDRTTDYLCKLDKERKIQSDRTDRPFKYTLLSS